MYLCSNLLHYFMMTISTSTRKLITSLKQAKHRKDQGLFVVEGTRAVLDTVPFFDVEYLVATSRWIEEYGMGLPGGLPAAMLARTDDMERMSSLTTPQGVLAVCRMPHHDSFAPVSADELVIALDKVQDPGNLGTIMRVADWFGVTRILASEDTVDVYNPKVVQATMGAIARVGVCYCDLRAVLMEAKKDGVAVYGTFLDGENIYSTSLTAGGIVVMGNEGNGISDEIAAVVGNRIKIPAFPPERATVESLNVSMATGITLAEFRRRAG